MEYWLLGNYSSTIGNLAAEENRCTHMNLGKRRPEHFIGTLSLKNYFLPIGIGFRQAQLNNYGLHTEVELT